MSAARVGLACLVGRPLVPYFDDSEQVNESVVPPPSSFSGVAGDHLPVACSTPASCAPVPTNSCASSVPVPVPVASAPVEDFSSLTYRPWNKDGYFEAPVPVTSRPAAVLSSSPPVSAPSSVSPPLIPAQARGTSTRVLHTPPVNATATTAATAPPLMLLTPTTLLSAQSTKAADSPARPSLPVGAPLLPLSFGVGDGAAVSSAASSASSSPAKAKSHKPPIPPSPPAGDCRVDAKPKKSSKKGPSGSSPPSSPATVNGVALIAALAASMTPVAPPPAPLQTHIVTDVSNTHLHRTESAVALKSKGKPKSTNKGNTGAAAAAGVHRSLSQSAPRNHRHLDETVPHAVSVKKTGKKATAAPAAAATATATAAPQYFAWSAFQCSPDPSQLPAPKFD